MTYADISKITYGQAQEIRRQAVAGDPESARAFVLYTLYRRLQTPALNVRKRKFVYACMLKSINLEVEFVGR